jgi:hypothetical protein
MRPDNDIAPCASLLRQGAMHERRGLGLFSPHGLARGSAGSRLRPGIRLSATGALAGDGSRATCSRGGTAWRGRARRWPRRRRSGAGAPGSAGTAWGRCASARRRPGARCTCAASAATGGRRPAARYRCARLTACARCARLTACARCARLTTGTRCARPAGARCTRALFRASRRRLPRRLPLSRH